MEFRSCWSGSSPVGRIRVPTWEEVVKVWPADSPVPKQPIPTLWRRICTGYQPVLSEAWSACNKSFHEETTLDVVFQQSLFWVVTRSLDCFYCMGHTEMMLQVAGLDGEALTDRTRRLAGTDWSSFPPAQRIAFDFARKVTKEPWTITAADVQSLLDHFGDEGALDVIWWSSRGNYMTRISNAFQMPLERENVFKGRVKVGG